MKEMTQEEYRRALSWLVHGIFYGYPMCCIKEFVHTLGAPTREKYPKHPAFGTGFVPCVECAGKSHDSFDAWVHQNITANRMAQRPFPETVSMSEKDEWTVANKLKAAYQTNPLF